MVEKRLSEQSGQGYKDFARLLCLDVSTITIYQP